MGHSCRNRARLKYPIDSDRSKLSVFERWAETTTALFSKMVFMVSGLSVIPLGDFAGSCKLGLAQMLDTIQQQVQLIQSKRLTTSSIIFVQLT